MLKKLFHKLLRLSHRCPCQEDLFGFVLDGLPHRIQKRVRQHLAECESCREQVKDYAWVSEGIALTASQVDPPKGLCEKVKHRIRQES